MLSNEGLMSYYKTNFALIQHHKYSLTELEEMIPYEREIYITLLVKHLEEEKQKQAQRKQAGAGRKR